MFVFKNYLGIVLSFLKLSSLKGCLEKRVGRTSEGVEQLTERAHLSVLTHILLEISGLRCFLVWVISWFYFMVCSISVKDGGCWGLLMCFVDELKLWVLGGGTVFLGFFFFFFSYNVRKPTTLAHRWFVLSLCPQGTLICLALPLLHPWRSLQSLSSPRQGKARTCQRLLASLMMMTMMTFLQHPIASLPRQVLLQPLFLGISSEKECWLKKDMKVL